MSSIKSVIEKTQTYNMDGSVVEVIKEQTTNIQRSAEPDYIKLYTRMWCEFNGIPAPYRELFLQLAIRMSYCNAADIQNSQLVNTGGPWGESIRKALDWKPAMYQRGLRALCDCGAIRKCGRGVYQINPSYASRGEWKYNPRLARGGVEDLVATFKFKSGEVDTRIVWADDGRDEDENLREALGPGAVLKRTAITPVYKEDEVLPF